MLFRQTIKVEKSINKGELEELYTQKANRKIKFTPLSPLIGIHYLGKQFYKPKKYEKKIAKTEQKFEERKAKAKTDRKVNNLEFRKQNKLTKLHDRLQNGNQVMQWGEPVAVFDTANMNITVERFKEYLFAHGYFQNKVEAKVLTIGKLVNIRYTIEPGGPYMLDSVFYKIPDSTVYELILISQKNSFLKKGDRYEQNNFTKERERIDLFMKDHGYYDFSRQYVEFNIDTAYRANRKIGVEININEPAKRNHHKKFYIEEVHFTTDAGVISKDSARQSRVTRNISYHYYKKLYSQKILSRRVFVKTGDAYSRQKTFDTQRQLSNLNVFKFVNVNYDTSGGRFIANIYTSPLDRYQWSNEVGLSVTQGFPGPFYNVNFLKRNIFRGLENFEMNGRIGYEGVAAATSTSNVLQSTEAGINASVTFPQFLFPLSEDTRYKLGRLNPRTRIQVGYNYTDRPEYQRASTSVNYTYSWENQRIRRFDFTLASLSVINSTTSTVFQSFLQQQYDSLGNTLIFSFRPSFVSSMLFSMTWNHNNYGSPDKSSAFIRWSIESGGTLQNFITYKAIENQGLRSFKYIRANADLRRINVINKNTTLAYRFNAGAAYSYDSRDVLPYEKYFFVGGSNSVRAWRPRRLGQGSFQPIISSDIAKNGYYDYKFEKPGNVVLEASIELRKKLFGFVEGALFIDAGNVWTFEQLLKTENGVLVENGNSIFKLDQFFKEFGVGTGFGLRFNFSFLILRFDVGMKVYDPAREDGDRFVLDNLKFFKPFGINKEPVIYNIGIGYPF